MQCASPKLSRFAPWAALGILAALASALYLPFLGNPLVYDDKGFFVGSRFAELATSPLGLRTRSASFFSIAFVEVAWGRIEAHRIASLLLHIACAWAVYGLLRQLQRLRADAADEPRYLAPVVGAALFALHPVAVYAAAYLAQRGTVMATLFALLSLVMYARGLRTASYSDALVAALLYTLAVLSKESALVAPAAAAAMVPLARAGRGLALRYTAGYLAACAPAALLTVFLSKGVIGQVYEPQFEAVAMQAAGPDAESAAHGWPWAASALAQAGLFWRYLAFWLWPRTAEMSFDLRIDFADYWSPVMAGVAVMGFVTFGVAAAALMLRGSRRAAMAGFGLLYFWIMFVVEFAAVRFQEPLQLYRSYLWAPGLALAAASGLGALPRRAILLACVPLVSLLGWQAHDRLSSFSSGLALWQDAAAKLPPRAVPGGHRALYELAREYLYAGRNDEAVRTTRLCLDLYPRVYDCQFAMGAIHLYLGEDQAAVPYFSKAIAIRPDAWAARLRLGQALENLGCIEQAKAQYREALGHGYVAGRHYLDRMEAPGKGLLPPSARRSSPATRCP